MHAVEPPARPDTAALRVAASASLAAGAVHAAAAGAHGEHRPALWTFALLAGAQLVWGGVALRRADRRLAAIGAVLGATAIAGWAMATSVGIGVIDGLDRPPGVQVADALAAALAAVSLAGSVLHLAGRVLWPRLAGPAVAALVASALPGMAAAGTHDHHDDADDVAAAHAHDEASGSHDGHADDHQGEGDGADGEPRPYDPAQPIDLGGVDGVTPEQQARAENLVAVTLLRLPRFADPAVAEANGYHSIGDGFTGYEHYVNRSLINDGVVLDPDVPESLVYQVRDGTKQLVAAMFMLGEGETLDTVPDVGGRLTQWHIHNNLCYTPDPVAPRVAGLTGDDGTCPPPLVKGVEVPMIHVWIVPHPCGPFAALEGVAGGQIAAGEERWCDHAHGSA